MGMDAHGSIYLGNAERKNNKEGRLQETSGGVWGFVGRGMTELNHGIDVKPPFSRPRTPPRDRATKSRVGGTKRGLKTEKLRALFKGKKEKQIAQ